MKRQSAWLTNAAMIFFLIAALGMAPQSMEARDHGSGKADHHALDPMQPRDGEPLLGMGYPQEPVARPVPQDWMPTTPPAGIDLDVTYINRTPMYKAYCVEYPGGIPILCSGTETEKRWPSPGEIVTFTAHIVNKGTTASPSFAYKWLIDGVEVDSGTHPALAAGDEGTASYQWAWSHTMDGERVVDDHTVSFAVDPDSLITETYKSNNSLTDRTNALGFLLAITPEMYEAYNTPWDPALSYSAEDWLQRQITAMNSSLAGSIYPSTPDGATERVRINSITITPSSPIWDRSSDGGWFVDADYRIVSGGYDPVVDVDWNLVHELSHQIGMIDLYNLNIAETSVKVLDQAGAASNVGFDWPRPGLMGGGDLAPHTDPHLYSSHSAGGFSSTKGYRRGYYGEYQFDISEQNYLLILDNQGDPAGDVQVALYQRTGPSNWAGEPDLDNTPEIVGATGNDGRLLLTNRSAGGGVTTSTGHTLHDNPFGQVDVVGQQNRALLKLGKGDHEEFAWIDITELNLAYWQGNTMSSTLVLTSHVPPADAPAAPQGAKARVEGAHATLCWDSSPSTDLLGYYVYRAAPPTYIYEQASGLLNDLCFQQTLNTTRIYAVTALDSAGRESGFSNFVWTPYLIHPHAVGMASDSNRTVLDPQNRYALLRQQSDGRYLQNLGSVHYHLEYSHFASVDEQDRLLFSHPGDEYSSRHSVRIADLDAMPILEFGQRGSDPGEFETPAGVIAFGEPSSIEGPYAVDEHTLLLLHFDGSYDGAQGELGTPNGTAFETGRYGQGVSVDTSDTLTYGSTGNIQRTEGAIEFWLRPTWDGGDGESHVFFELGDAWFNRMLITKDGANNLRFIVWDSSTEYGVAYHVGHWQAGEWHHVAVTWTGTEIAMYVDGQLQECSSASPPDILADTIYIGSSRGHDMQADAVLDELRISDIPRIGNGSTYRIMVADSGNHRIQAFDEWGHFVSTYGELGSGPGQFSQPQGLAVDGAGRVIVADMGNDRLQILSFDGTDLGFVQSVTGGFQAPTGVAARSDGQILVADTGNDRVVELDANGNAVAEYTEANDGYTGPFSKPRGVGWDSSGDIVVADTGNQRVVTILTLPLASFRAAPRSGQAPLIVHFVNDSGGPYGETHWDFGDGAVSILGNPTHKYTVPGSYTVTLTISGLSGMDTLTRTNYIMVETPDYWVNYLPLVLRQSR